MRYSLTLLEEHHRHLLDLIFGIEGTEGAAFLRCGVSTTDGELRLLVRHVERVEGEEYLVREPLRLSLKSTSYARVAKRAANAGEAVIFVHSHPTGIADFSPQDDREEPRLMQFLRERLGGETPIGSLVVSSKPSHSGRLWLDGTWARMDVLRVVGSRFRFLGLNPQAPARPEFFDRQIRAFGEDVQRALGQLVVGVVGVGGTGSAVLAQLVRLGVGIVYLFDGDTFESTNVNRVFGSSTSDDGRMKTAIQRDEVQRIDLPTRVVEVPTHITQRDAALRLRECDVIFGCTDKERPRGILNELALRYLIPVLDTAVLVDSEDSAIRGVFGRVTTVLPGEACLFCRNRIKMENIHAESLEPEARERQAAEGYVPELEGNAPAVIPFTTAVASQAVMELLHRMTGFMGADRESTEVLLMLDHTECRRNRRAPDPHCVCAERSGWGRGDHGLYLGLMW